MKEGNMMLNEGGTTELQSSKNPLRYIPLHPSFYTTTPLVLATSLPLPSLRRPPLDLFLDPLEAHLLLFRHMLTVVGDCHLRDLAAGGREGAKSKGK